MPMRLLLSIAVLFVSTCLSSAARGATSSASVPSPFGGNGHNVTFDGRLFIVARADGWVLQLLVPENIDTSGALPGVGGAFTPPVLIQPLEQCENALALCHESPASTPFACDDAGTATASGTFACYDLVVIDSNACGTAPNELRSRRLKVWVESPSTPSAHYLKHEWIGERTALARVGVLNSKLRGIEPTVTRDGKLMIWQGHPSNNGEIDMLMYATNEDACAQSGWHGPFNLSHLVNDPVVNTTYRLAERVLRAADGTPFQDDDLVHGAYPWVFPDGDAINFTSVTVPCRSENDPAGCGPRRGGLAVLGYPTNWGLAHIDGGVNPDTDNSVRLFFSSPGPTTFAALPLTEGVDVWPFFGSNTANYAEIVFDDGLDGRYAGVWLMNESVTHGGALDRTRTPDTSGYFNTGIVDGAAFPLRNEGPRGKTLAFNGANARVRVPHDVSLDVVNAITVQMTLRPDAPVDCDANNNWRVLLDKGGIGAGAYSLVFEEGETFQARVHAGGEERAISANASIPIGAWSDIAFSYQASTGRMSFFVNGVETNSVVHPPALLDADGADVLIGGPASSRPACADGAGGFLGQIEELRISRVDRFHDEPFPAGEGEGEGEAGEGEGEAGEGEGEAGEGEGEGEGDGGAPIGPGVDPLGNDDNGQAPGCASAPARDTLALALLGLALLRRRRRG